MGSVIITVNDDWKGFGVIELAAGISYDDVGFWWSTDCCCFAVGCLQVLLTLSCIANQGTRLGLR